MSNKDGGNAFPFEGTVHLSSSKGMSLRDYFAAKAMQALIGVVNGNASKEGADDAVCGVAYIYADKMLLAREVFFDYSKKEEVKEDE